MKHNFCKRFNIDISLEEAQRRFVNRLANSLFTEWFWDWSKGNRE